MSLTQLQQDIANKSFHKIYYLCGDEPYLVNFYLGALKRALLGEDADMDLYVFDGETLCLESFCDTMGLFPVLALKKMVQITDCPLSKSSVSSYLVKHKELLNEDTVVVFYEQTVKINRTAEAAKSFFKMVREQGLYVEVKKLDEKTLLKWTAKQCRLLNISMSAQTAEYFLHSVGNDMFTVRNELEKLAAFCKGRQATAQDVDFICTRSIDSQGYLITDAILTKNLDRAYSLLDDYARMKSGAEMIAGIIFNFVGRLYKIKYLSSSGQGITQIAAVVGMKEYPVKKYLATVRDLDMKRIEQMLDICTAADVSIKASNTDNYVILTRLAAQLAAQL